MIRIGVIGAGFIANKFCDAVNNSNLDGKLAAIASRSLDKAEKFKEKHNFEKAYGSYEELFKDKDIDLIYVATPHGLHYNHMMEILEYNKNILCEKPFTLNAKQAKEVFKKAKNKNVFIMEALWTRFLPTIREVKELTDDNIIGDIVKLEADFCFTPNKDDDHRLFQPKLGGGALLDVGIYPITFANIFMGRPKNFNSDVKMYKTGVDIAETIYYNYPDRQAILKSALNYELPLLAKITGTKGKIIIEGLHETESAKIYDLDNKLIREVNHPHEVNGFEYEIKEAIKCIKYNKLESDIMPHSETLNVLTQMDNIRESWNFFYPQEKN
ncbi:MAG: Gfo/Idh/MocA family oxidoreductase [Candidatus Izimaplasma sp.]|nr:Gfo/Idh/MocA family oxidoreductase [Candidatus Izimaplasma bacterium]